MDPVHSHRNRRVVEAARLHRARERHATGKTIIEGPHLLHEAIAAGIRPEVLFMLEDDRATSALALSEGITSVRVTEEAMARLGGTRSPRGPVGVVVVPVPQATTGRQGLLVSWGVQDPGNVGALIRVAAAFDWGFGYLAGTADPWSPKVLRAGAGSQFRLRPMPVAGLDELSEMGFVSVSSVVRDGVAPRTLRPGRYALLVGEEGAGLPDDVVVRCDARITIPMPGGLESLNAAVAAGIIVYELSKPERQRGGQV